MQWNNGWFPMIILWLPKLQESPSLYSASMLVITLVPTFRTLDFEDIRHFRDQKVSLKMEHKLWCGWEQCSWPNLKYYLIGSKNLLTLTFIKSMLNKRKQVQQFFSVPNPWPFCWAHPFKNDLLPVSCSTFIHRSRSFFLCWKSFHIKQTNHSS